MILLIIGFLGRTTLNNFISLKMKEQNNAETTLSVEKQIDEKYNYSKNGQDYEITLFEFGSTGCTICKQMETELDKIRKSKSGKINVIFLNTSYTENQNFVKFYGISAIPMQVMLDKNGVESFKHYGFITAGELMEKALEMSLNKKTVK